MATELLFLHGLDSSSKGTKGRYFTANFSHIIAPDFTGNLQERMHALETVCENLSDTIMIGSSFGGLMAACYAIARPDKVRKLILLAPALNFSEYAAPAQLVNVPTLLIIGDHDTVTPPNLVIPAARATFSQLEILVCDDDHLLKTAFFAVDWPTLLA
jgi:pimeloyl-ACP methyl ester carboxylesterase